MKIKNIFLSLAAATMLLTACGNDDLELGNSTTAPVEASCPAVEFSTANKSSFEVDPSDPSVSFKVQRKATDAASYPIKVVEGADNFNVPASVDFAAGETEKDIKVTVKESAAQGTPLSLELTFDDANLNPYTQGIKDFTASVTVIKWEAAGSGVWMANVINTFFGVDPQPLAVTIEKATTATAVKYRFKSPYVLCTSQDELGVFNGYPYAEEGDLTSNGGTFVITVTKDGASLAPVQLGMDFGYGEFTIGQIYGNLSSNIASYPLGVFKASETGGVIAWPASSLFISMASYKDGQAVPCDQGPAYLFLSTEDYKASMEE
ncbi:MAG: hypothetical protein ACOCM9_05715 [Segatella copri]